MAEQEENKVIADAPLFIGLVGFLIIIILMFNQSINQSWGFALGIFFAILFISSILSISPELPEYVKKKQRKL